MASVVVGGQPAAGGIRIPGCIPKAGNGLLVCNAKGPCGGPAGLGSLLPSWSAQPQGLSGAAGHRRGCGIRQFPAKSRACPVRVCRGRNMTLCESPPALGDSMVPVSFGMSAQRWGKGGHSILGIG